MRRGDRVHIYASGKRPRVRRIRYVFRDDRVAYGRVMQVMTTASRDWYFLTELEHYGP